MSTRRRSRTAQGGIVRAVAGLVLCVQVVPAGVPILAELAHGFYHFSQSLSLDYLLHSHVHAHGPGAHDGSFAHAHPDPFSPDGRAGQTDEVSDRTAIHDHVPALDALLAAAGDSEVSEIAAPAPTDRAVDLHLPSPPAGPALSIVSSWLGHGGIQDAPPAIVSALEPPPPRA